MVRRPALTPNGLIPHEDFPFELYEAVHAKVSEVWSGAPAYQQYSSAWNALAYRFHGCVDAGTIFQKSLLDFGPHPAPQHRFKQEQALFNFFSNGFAAFESLFYGIFAVGSFIDPIAFPLATSKEQQRISPPQTYEVFKRAFPDDQILESFTWLFDDLRYKRWREMRNVLTHRAAPGRRIYVGIGTNDSPPVEWKLNDLPLDSALVPKHQGELAELISSVLSATQEFLTARV